jgi:REP element-mobilizing transposase RayT
VNYFESASPDAGHTQSEQKENKYIFDSRLSFVEMDKAVEEERQFVGSESDGVDQSEAFQSAPLELSYTCLLIPRFSDHYLTGDITFSLPVWMKDICVSYGWRLESIVVRPGYLQWVISVPPEVYPAHIIRITRQHTSQKILSEFPRYKQQNLAGDFWAPGYSMISGKQLQSPELISNFIQITRKQQGIY